MIHISADHNLIKTVLEKALETHENRLKQETEDPRLVGVGSYPSQGDVIKARAALIEFNHLKEEITEFNEYFDHCIANGSAEERAANSFKTAQDMALEIKTIIKHWNNDSDFKELLKLATDLHIFLKDN